MEVTLNASLTSKDANLILGRSSDFIARACPCCQRSDLLKNDQIKSEMPAENLTFEEVKNTWQHFFKLKTFFTYHRCSSCGQLYSPIFFDSVQLSSLYSRMSDNTAHLPAAIVSKTQQHYFTLLKSFGALKGTYLEFGPDIGLLTQACVQGGEFNRLILIEPNLGVHDTLAKVSAGMDCQIHADIDAYRNVADGSVDTIAMIHVLDHLLEPAKILKTLRQKLKIGGKLFIVTHDESSLMARILGSRWPAYCLQHPQLYNPNSISNSLAAEGFKILGVKKTYNYFPVTYLLKHLFWALKIGQVRLPDCYWLTLPLKLGNIATVATIEGGPK